METIQIGSAGNADQVQQRLEFEASFMRDEGFAVDLTRLDAGGDTFFAVRCQPTESSAIYGEPDELASMVRHHLANAVSDLIVNLWERDLLGKLVNQECGTLSSDERSLVTRYAEMVLDGHPWQSSAGLMRKVARKGRVLREIDSYLSSNAVLNIDGFLRFRLGEYTALLENAVEQALDEFMLEKEYREFILLLRHFLAAQEPRLDQVHVIVKRDGSFRLVDDEGSSITEQFLADCLMETGTRDVNRDDLLISALITVAPRKVRLHLAKGTDTEGLKTLRAVFAERLTTCHGCEICGFGTVKPIEEREGLFH